jgi:hypothetical protein
MCLVSPLFLGEKVAQCVVKFRRYVVQITPAFKCGGVWPRSSAAWPQPHIAWPSPHLVAEVKTEGFDLLSKESPVLQAAKNNQNNQQPVLPNSIAAVAAAANPQAAQGTTSSTMEGDAWVISFAEAEMRLLHGGYRRRCLSILKTLRDRHLDLPGIKPVLLCILV